MSKILQKWVQNKLGIVIDYSMPTLTETVINGNILPNLLFYYGLINENRWNFPTNATLMNLKYVYEYIVSLGIDYTEIPDDKDMSLLKLLYHLYLILLNSVKLNDHIYFSLKTGDSQTSFTFKKTRVLIFQIKHKYLNFVDKCKQTKQTYLDQYDRKSKMDSLIKMKELKAEYLFEIKKSLQQRFAVSDALLSMNKSNANNNNNNNNNKPCGPCVSDTNLKYRYVLYNNKLTSEGNKDLQRRLNSKLFIKLLNAFRLHRRCNFKHKIYFKILKQANYEHQMRSKLLEVCAQEFIIIKNIELERDLLTMKNQEIHFNVHNQRTFNLELTNQRLLMEKDRYFQLHKMIHYNKLKQQYEQNYTACLKVMSDLADLASFLADYKIRFEVDEVPEEVMDEYVALFCADQPILSSVKNVDNIVKVFGSQQNVTVTDEINRQNAICEKNITDYLNCTKAWGAPDDLEQLYFANVKKFTDDFNCLSCIVHKLLRIKYPLPTSSAVVELPEVVTACDTTQIYDEVILSKLKDILKENNVMLIRTHDAVIACLNYYCKAEEKQNEMLLIEHDDDDVSYNNGRNKSRNLFNPLPTDNTDVDLVPFLIHLGLRTYQTLYLGDTLVNDILATIFLEYLKSLFMIRGWVIINFPDTHDDAVVFEMALKNKLDMLVKSIKIGTYDDVFLQIIHEIALGKFISRQNSRLFTNRFINKEYLIEQAYLTSFMKLTKIQTTFNDEDKHVSFYKTDIEKFYEKFQCNFSMDYCTFDDGTVQQILHEIGRDDIFVPEILDELMIVTEAAIIEREIMFEQMRLEEEVRLAKERKQKGGAGDKSKDTSKKSSDKSSKAATKDKKVKILDVPKKIVPGEDAWEYVDLVHHDALLSSIATTWENIEEMYLHNFKQVFFIHRIYQNSIVPYVHQIRVYMRHFIARPDNKQEIYYELRNNLNLLMELLFHDDECDIEAHNIIAEFKSKLSDLICSKLIEAEEERVRIINDHWFSNLAFSFSSNYASAMQLEVDRCINTFQCLQDYYSAIVNKPYSDKKATEFLLQILLPTDDVRHFISSIYIDTKLNLTENQYTDYFQRIVDLALNYINASYTSFVKNSKKVCDQFGKKGKKGKDQSKKSSKKGASDKTTEPGTKVITIEDRIDAMREEWKSAMDAEYVRTKFRLHLIQRKATDDIYRLLITGKNLFHEINAHTHIQHYKEMNELIEIIDMVTQVVESNKEIHPNTVIFKHDKHYKIKVEYYSAYKCSETLDMQHSYGDFTVAQLQYLLTIFAELAPFDSISIKQFSYMLQDMISLDVTDYNSAFVPVFWTWLTPSQIATVITNTFGNMEYISWKDFIIYELQIPYPTDADLSEMRHQFKTLDKDKMEYIECAQFTTVKLWFEKRAGFCPKRSVLLRRLFRNLFVCGQCIIYPALLLAVCKSQDSMAGVARTFGICLGSPLWLETNAGTNYMDICRYDYFFEKEESLDILYAAETFCHRILCNHELMSKCTQSLSGDGDYIVASQASLITENPLFIQFLLFNIFFILSASLPCHLRENTFYGNRFKEQLHIFELMDAEQIKHFALEFFNSKSFQSQLDKTTKFLIKSPANIVKSIINEICVCKCSEHSITS